MKYHKNWNYISKYSHEKSQYNYQNHGMHSLVVIIMIQMILQTVHVGWNCLEVSNRSFNVYKHQQGVR